MRNTTPCRWLTAVAVFAAATAPLAAVAQAQKPAMTPQRTEAAPFAPVPEMRAQNGVRYVVGGAGEEARAAMRKVAPQYNLHLSFSAGKDNQYLAGVTVKVVDAQNRTVLETDRAGPWLYAKLPPGTYRVTASARGDAQTRSIAVGEKAEGMSYFHWAGPMNG